ncbi:MAG: transketolase, partial [Anaerolineae bacterium SM23_ 63]
VALERTTGPTALALTRQAVPTLDRERFASAEGLRKGAYVLADLGEGKPRLILIASGSEVSVIIEAGERLAEKGVPVRLVSFPSWELFSEQPLEDQEQVLPPNIPARVVIEAGVTQGWERWVNIHGAVIGLDRFGASAPYRDLYQNLGLTVERVVKEAERVIAEVIVLEERS